MKVILLSGGSLGDTLPFALVGKHLQSRGHRVALVATGKYESIARDFGLDFAPSMSTDSFDRFITSQHHASLMEKVRLSAQAINEAIEPSLDAIFSLHEPGQTLLCWQGFMVAGRIAQEVLGCPSTTVQVYPAGFRTADIAPPFDRWPGFLRRLVIGQIDQIMYKDVKRAVEMKRRVLGLKADRRPLRHWWGSPDLQLGLFPDWFQSPQPDWPTPTILTGFPLPDRDTSMSLPADLDRFLDTGQPTIVFAPSSLTRATTSFFEQSIDLARRLSMQALFLTSQQDLLPSPLPSFVAVHPFAPLDLLLPRCEAIVHQGGIGTIAQSIRAGLPQVTTPVAYDQPDNAYRLAKLGVSLNVPPNEYWADRLVDRFKALLTSANVKSACRVFADRIERNRPLDIWADSLERVFHRQRIVAPGTGVPE
ncbi:glycosyltransferase [bacterium]|nr:glycosyltransferase [bacterium]